MYLPVQLRWTGISPSSTVVGKQREAVGCRTPPGSFWGLIFFTFFPQFSAISPNPSHPSNDFFLQVKDSLEQEKRCLASHLTAPLGELKRLAPLAPRKGETLGARKPQARTKHGPCRCKGGRWRAERFDSGWQHPGHARGTWLAWLGDLGRWDMGLVELQLPFFGPLSSWIVSFRTNCSKQTESNCLSSSSDIFFGWNSKSTGTWHLSEMMQVERLEAELEVYQMKNSSLMKQAGHHHSIPPGLVESKGGGFFLLVRWKAKVIDWTRQCRAVKVRMRSMKLFWPACRVRTEQLNIWSNLLRKMRLGCSAAGMLEIKLIQNVSVGHQETFGWKTEAAGQSTTGRRSIASWDPLLEFTFNVRCQFYFCDGQSFEGDHDRQTRGTHFLEK